MFEQQISWSPGGKLVGGLIFLGVSATVLGPALLIRQGSPPWPLLWGIWALTLLLFLGVYAVFATLRIAVDGQSLTVGFGPFRDRIPLEQIESCRPIQYKWTEWGGWGIRSGRRAKLYNVYGDGGVAVQVVLQNGRRVLFSASDPEAVCRALLERRPEIRGS